MCPGGNGVLRACAISTSAAEEVAGTGLEPDVPRKKKARRIFLIFIVGEDRWCGPGVVADVR